MSERLKAPFPWFGGKSRVAGLVWGYLGDPDNYVEPFFGSGATLLLRPHPARIETANDMDSYVANFWRATGHDPEAVAAFADGPVSEVDLHSRHRWLVLGDDAAAFRKRMRTEPDYYDPKIAGWWCWGLCCWIGSGWCQTPESAEWAQRPAACWSATGVHTNGPPGGSGDRSPLLGGGHGQYGHGIHAKGQLPKLSSGDGMDAVADGKVLSQQIPLIGDPARGVHRGPGEIELRESRPMISGGGARNANGEVKGGRLGNGVHAKGPAGTHRPQLADAYDIGRGVHSHGDLGTCAQRRAWLLDWFGRLRDRLRTVRVCCGDWSRVVSSESVTTRLGTTGIFFDPPYGTGSGRDEKLYSTDSMTVAADVRRWCLENGSRPNLRIVLAGYAGEGHEELEAAGWTVEAWKASGGYGNRSQKGKDNSAKERLWCSPGCRHKPTLMDLAGVTDEV